MAVTNLVSGTDAILAGATSHVITHGLNDTGAILIGAATDWNDGYAFKTGQGANTITIAFPFECPTGGGNIDWTVGTNVSPPSPSGGEYIIFARHKGRR